MADTDTRPWLLIGPQATKYGVLEGQDRWGGFILSTWSVLLTFSLRGQSVATRGLNLEVGASWGFCLEQLAALFREAHRVETQPKTQPKRVEV